MITFCRCSDISFGNSLHGPGLSQVLRGNADQAAISGRWAVTGKGSQTLAPTKAACWGICGILCVTSSHSSFHVSEVMQCRNAPWALCTSSVHAEPVHLDVGGRVAPHLEEEGIVPASFAGLLSPAATGEKGLCLYPGVYRELRAEGQRLFFLFTTFYMKCLKYW